jgi:hypothetical protein
MADRPEPVDKLLERAGPVLLGAEQQAYEVLGAVASGHGASSTQQNLGR